MQIKIGEKIRELRRRDGRKQEDLANALGVSNQAVSRWEANGGYPDLEMIPAIANYFHVSTDELFGYHGDREEKIKAILDRADRAIRAQGNILVWRHGDLAECVEMLRDASEEFPNEPEILFKLAEALHRLGWEKYGGRMRIDNGSDYLCEDSEYHAQNVYWQEALRIYEKLTKMELTAEQRGVAVFSMSVLLKRVGEHEKAKKLVNQQSSILYCKEILMQRVTEGEETDKYHGEAIITLLQELCGSVSELIVLKKSLHSSEYARQALLALAELYETVFIDGRCGCQHRIIRNLYLRLADYEAEDGGDLQKAVAYFDKGFHHHRAYCEIRDPEEYRYSAPLVEKAISPAAHFPKEPENFWKITMDGKPDRLCDELRKHEKYAECFE